MGASHRLSVLADMELPAIDDLRYLFGLQTSVMFGKHVYYGFLNSHALKDHNERTSEKQHASNDGLPRQ